jgi:hypothetical protein
MEVNQFELHLKPTGWKVCPVCGCENVRAGVKHRALTAHESWEQRALWVKRIKVCFGTDFSIEPIRDKTKRARKNGIVKAKV